MLTLRMGLSAPIESPWAPRTACLKPLEQTRVSIAQVVHPGLDPSQDPGRRKELVLTL